MTDPFFVKLPNRGLIQIEGTDRHEFLQGLITNDIHKLKAGSCLYACLLTPQGKFLHDFFIHEGYGVLLLDCEGGARAQDLYKRLNMYRLRKDVQVSVEENHTVFGILESQNPRTSEESNSEVLKFSNSEILVKDPRHKDMGYRSFEKPDWEEKPFEVWDERRITLAIPDGSRDMVVERSTMLESHMDTLNALDWDKGCYMGQELTARTHYRGLTKKHLYTVHSDKGFAEPFTKLDNGGEMRSSCGSLGLALLKDEEAGKMETTQEGYKIIDQ